jgi:hypothetical protein
VERNVEANVSSEDDDFNLESTKRHELMLRLFEDEYVLKELVSDELGEYINEESTKEKFTGFCHAKKDV